MKYQFIEQEKQRFPVVVMCQVLGVSESGRSLLLIKADMEARACTPSCVTRGKASPVSAWLG